VGLYDIVQGVSAQLTQNFTADLTAILSARSLSLDPTVTVYPRLMGPYILEEGNGLALPGIGVYLVSADTNAKTQTQRKWKGGTAIDYVAQLSAQDDIFAQMELAVEAIMKSIDRIDFAVWTGIAGGSGGVYGAGDQELGTKVRFLPPTKLPDQALYSGRVIVTVPTWQQDQGL